MNIPGLSTTVTYWAPLGRNDYGMRAFAQPVKIVGRWEDRVEQARNQDGEEITSKAVAFTKDALQPEGYLAIGDHVNVADPLAVANALEIRAVQSVPNVRNLVTLHKGYL
jgi:hypothetical protein